MKELLIFGRSPFIKKVPLSKINYDKYDVLCINYPIPDIKVHYVIACDEWVKPILAPKTEFISSNTGWGFIKTFTSIINEEKRLSWACFSSSAAVGFARLRGYKTIYLIGVDCVEDNKPMKHYDGIVNTKTTSDIACKKEKAYIKLYTQYMTIYQTNPAVKNDWQLPFMPCEQVFS